MFQIYKDRNEYCRYCGDRAKAYYQNTPVCHYHYKKQIENESEEKKLKKIWFSNLWDIRETIIQEVLIASLKKEKFPKKRLINLAALSRKYSCKIRSIKGN